MVSDGKAPGLGDPAEVMAAVDLGSNSFHMVVARNQHGEPSIVDPVDMTRRKRIPHGARHQDLLVPVLRSGQSVYDDPIMQKFGDRCSELPKP